MNPSTPERKNVYDERITWAPVKKVVKSNKIMENDSFPIILFPSIPSQNSAFKVVSVKKGSLLNAPKKAVQSSTERYDLGEFTPTSLKF